MPYSATLGFGSEFYGAKLKSIKEQFSKYVRPLYVDDVKDISSDELTFGLDFQRTQASISDFFATPMPNSTAVEKASVAKPMR